MIKRVGGKIKRIYGVGYKRYSYKPKRRVVVEPPVSWVKKLRNALFTPKKEEA